MFVYRSRNFSKSDDGSCVFVYRVCVSACMSWGCSAVGIGEAEALALESAWYPAKLWDRSLQPFIINFARNSVVRQIRNVAKTAEFQRCDFKV